MLYKRAARCSRTRWPSVHEDNFWTENLVTNIVQDERYIGTNIYGKRSRDMVGCPHTVKMSRDAWVVVEGTHESIVTPDEFDRAQAALRKYHEHIPSGKTHLLAGKVCCGVCGHRLNRSGGKNEFYFCRTMQVVSNTDCIEVHIPQKELMAEIRKSLRTQAAIVIEREKLLAERRMAAQDGMKNAISCVR